MRWAATVFVVILGLAALGYVALRLFASWAMRRTGQLDYEDAKIDDRWPDSMCNHCRFGEVFPECPNDYARDFDKEPGPVYCDWLEELPASVEQRYRADGQKVD